MLLDGDWQLMLGASKLGFLGLGMLLRVAVLIIEVSAPGFQDLFTILVPDAMSALECAALTAAHLLQDRPNRRQEGSPKPRSQTLMSVTQAGFH